MSMIGGQELLLILLIVVILFGAKKIPELAKGLGSGIKEFKKAAKETESQLKDCSTEEKTESSKTTNK